VSGFFFQTKDIFFDKNTSQAMIGLGFSEIFLCPSSMPVTPTKIFVRPASQQADEEPCQRGKNPNAIVSFNIQISII